MTRLRDIASVLKRYSTRYRYLDVFAVDVEDLQDARWRSLGNEDVTDSPEPLQVKHLGQGVLRFSLPSGTEFVGEASIGTEAFCALSTSIDRDRELLKGLAFGMLIGASTEAGPDMNRIMLLQFDAAGQKWTVYDGPLLGTVKNQLARIEGRS